MVGTRITQLAPSSTPTRVYGDFDRSVAQTLIPTAIASAEAFGAATIINTRNTPIGGITRLHINGVSGRIFGSFAKHIVPVGIVSAEAIGSHQIVGGTLVITFNGVASEEAIGTLILSAEGTIEPVGIVSDEAIGDHAVAPTGTIIPDSVDIGQALMEWDPNTEPDLAGYRVYIGTTSSVYDRVYDVGLTGNPSAPGYVVAGLDVGVLHYFAVTAYDTSNNEGSFSTEASFTPLGYRYGEVNVIGNVTLSATGIASTETIGTHTVVAGQVDVLPVGIVTSEAFGTQNIVASGNDVVLGPSEITSEEAFGAVTVTVGDLTLDLDGQAIASGEVIGDLTVIGSQGLTLSGITSLEAFGLPLVQITGGDQLVLTIAIPTQETIGTLQLDQYLVIPDQPSEEAFGTPALGFIIDLTGLPSLEAIGSVTVVPEAVDIFPSSIFTNEVVGTALIVPGDQHQTYRNYKAKGRKWIFQPD